MRLPARLGGYEVQSEIGRGANGVVYRAVDLRLHREVALKVLPPTTDRGETEAFLREARATARLRHPGVVVVYDAEVVDGVRLVALELVEGGSLAQRLKRDGPLPPREAARIVADLAAAVHAAHVQGIVHRDLKPANVLLEKDGRPRLTDFGLARDERGRMDSKSGDVVGTPAYMAPEQARGEIDRIGPWTDVWGLGAVLFECLAGETPFTGKTVVEVLEGVIGGRVPSLDAVRARRKLEPLSPDLVTVCTKALEKERDRRHSSAAALEEDLRRWLDGRPILSRRAGPARRALDAARRGWRAVALGLAVALAVIVALAVVPGVLDRSRRREHYARVLANVGTGEGKFLRDKAVFELTQEKDDVAAPLLVAAVERATGRLEAVTREKLLSLATPENDEERARQPRFERLKEALLALESTRPDERIPRPLVRTIEEARRRLSFRGQRSGMTATVLLAAEHRKVVGEEELLRSLVAIEALGRLGRTEAAVAIGRHLHAAEDDEHGVVAAQALGRLRDAGAARSVLRLDERHSRGGAFESRSMHALALEMAGKVPPFEPRAALDFLDRGRLRALLDDIPGGIEDMSRAVSLDPKDPFAWADRASLYLEKHDWPAACADLERAIALEPDVAGYLGSHAYGLYQRGDLDRALAEAERAVELDSLNARSWSTRGLVKVKRNDRAGALADLSRAIELDPRLADPWLTRASLRLTEDPAGAIEDDTRALALDPTLATAWNNRACAKHARGDLDGALADYARAIELSPKNARQYANRANTHLVRRDYTSAIADATRSLELDERDVTALCVRGRARVYKDDVDGARADLKRAVEIAPSDPSAWSALVLFHASRNDYEAALAAAEHQVEIGPDDANALTSRGFVRMKVGDLNGAFKDCRRATELKPLDATMWSNLADVLLTARDYKRGLEASERAVRLDPRPPSSWRRNAQFKMGTGDLKGALADATRAVEINGHDAGNLFLRSEIHRQLGELDAALRDLRATLALFGPKDDTTELKARIEAIERLQAAERSR